MKTEHLTTVFLVIVALALALTIVLVVFRLDQEQLFTLALVLVGGLALAAIIAALALLFRARRPPEKPVVEKHYIKEKHTVDGRVPARPQIVTLPAPSNQLAGLYPHLLRAAYQSGRNAQRRPGWDEVPQEWEGEIIEVDPD